MIFQKKGAKGGQERGRGPAAVAEGVFLRGRELRKRAAQGRHLEEGVVTEAPGAALGRHDAALADAADDEAAARQLIDRTTATRNPFDVKYSKVEDADWETCASVLNSVSVKELLSKGW